VGFIRQRRVYRLNFADDTELAGLEVRARSVPLGEFMSIVGLADTAEPGSEEMQRLFSGFVAQLVSWNLEAEDGQPVPADLEGLYSQDFEFAMQLVLAWIEAIASVPGPLGAASPSGETSPAPSLPMEPLSPSPGS